MENLEIVDTSNKDYKINTCSEKETKMLNGNAAHGDAHEPEEVLVNGALENGKGKEEDEEEGGEDADPKDLQPGDELVVIQDSGFNIKIQAPGLDIFEIPVSSMELIQEIYQMLTDKEETCHRTCFTLQLDGVTLDNFAEVKSVEALKEGAVIKVVEEMYTVREARLHVRHIRDLLKSIDVIDCYTGQDCNSLSLLNIITSGNILEKKSSKSDAVDCTPPEYIMPGSKERPLLPLHPVQKELKGPQCLKVLTFSGWNPPPGHRKMHGDLLYIYVVTLENKKFHITASTSGFYVNQSTLDEFNPKPVQPRHVHHSLVELLNQISPLFKRNFQQLLKKRQQKHPFERVATPYQTYNWMAPTCEHTFDYIRSEDAFSSRLGFEEHIPGQTRDWNEELQTTREMPRKHLPERLIRERTVFKVHSDFVIAATKGAMLVIDGNIMAINPGEDAKMQMFLWNNIFFSLGFDVKDHFKEFGGDHAAYTAPGCDLQGVKAYAGLDLEGLYTLGTVVIDYRGYRVTAQSIIPGILEREQDQSVVYGSIDFGKTIVTNDRYLELLKKASQSLKIRPHKVLNSKGEVVELISSVECKGIVGNDGRHYILDLLRTFPPDVHYLSVDQSELNVVSREFGFPRSHKHKLACLRQELVDAFVENRYLLFVKSAATQFQLLKLKKLQSGAAQQDQTAETNNNNDKIAQIKDVAAKEEPVATDENKDDSSAAPLANNHGLDLVGEEAKKLVATLTGAASPFLDGSDALPKAISDLAKLANEAIKPANASLMLGLEAKPVEDAVAKTLDLVRPDSVVAEESKPETEDGSKEIVKKSARLVGSLSDSEFLIAFNTDLFQDHVAHAEENSENMKREKQLVIDAAAFILTDQIPGFVTDCLEHTSSPIDYFTLTESLHHHGINMRYLGTVTEQVAKHPQLSYLYSIMVSSVVTRSAKHLYKTYMQGVDSLNLASAISHFLNCYLGSYSNPFTQAASEEKHKKKNKRKNKGPFSIQSDNVEWTSETPKGLWKKIVDEAQEYYGFKVECDSVDGLVEKYSIQKVSMLRAFCKCVGIQLFLKEFLLDSKNKQAFTSEDVQNVFPIVKHIQPKATDAYHVFTSGQAKIQHGLLQEGYELVTEALNLLNNIYGAMHHEIAACARLLARLSYIMGDYGEALVYQQRAVLMSERVLGIDHPNTITEYAHLALYCFANNQISTALKLLYRAVYLAFICVGEFHPEVALFYCNIGLILHAVSEFDLSLKFLTRALELNSKFFGPKSLKCALNYHLIARTYSCKGDFRSALHSEKESYTIYKQLLGEGHDRTRESSECLKHLTNQAVKFQKTVNQLSKGEKINNIPSIQIQVPSLANVLETLNLVNGIVFVHISPEDIDKFREEVLRHQIMQKLNPDAAPGKNQTPKQPENAGEEPKNKSSADDQPPSVPNGGSCFDVVD